MAKNRTRGNKRNLRDQSRRLREGLIWFLKGFTLYDPRKQYPGFYLSPQQSYVLAVIKDAEGISPGDVARKLNLEKSHLTKIVNSLIELGAVSKVTDEKDRRRLVLMLTKKGKGIYEELEKVGIDSYVNLMKHVPEEEREAVIHAIDVLLEAMQELREKK